MDKLFIEDLPLKRKKVLMRVDFNVPLNAEGDITDASRIELSLPSIKYVLNQEGSLILMSHLGRPKNMVNKSLSLKPCAHLLSEILQKTVLLAPDCVGYEVEEMVHRLKPGEIILLENLRFHRAEEYPDEDPDFSKKLSSYADFYVNDAFGAAHRKHSSTYVVPQYFPGKAAAGYLMEKEIRMLSEMLKSPQRPFTALIGGSKIASKMGVLKALIQKVDSLLIAGGMSFTFLKSLGKEIGNSICEKELIPQAQEILKEAQKKDVNLLLPIDFVVAQECSNDVTPEIVTIEQGIPERYQGFDIGPQTIALFKKELKKAKTILWNGPVGVYELSPFSKGSTMIAKILGESDATTIVGGGDSLAVINNAEVASKITHVSTGGGASLEFIEQGTLPGVEALSPKLKK